MLNPQSIIQGFTPPSKVSCQWSAAQHPFVSQLDTNYCTLIETQSCASVSLITGRKSQDHASNPRQAAKYDLTLSPLSTLQILQTSPLLNDIDVSC
jgi:hypothetical protein